MRKDAWKRSFGKKVALKYLNNSQNITNEFLNEIKAYSILGPRNSNGILKAYGMSQNPKKKDFIIVLEYANGGNINNYDGNIIKNYYWSRKLEALSVIIMDLPKYDNVGTSNSVEIIDFTEGLFLPQVPIGSNVELARRLVEHETCHQLNPEGD
ncbi:kinase-like domain-containing protein [Rhizophagus irregularis DAOM 181602=DAOM 197198]|nr:kinase-like domain-containing protein [Rhizophagus irregularis DAOM 181602=DAOM 197198]